MLDNGYTWYMRKGREVFPFLFIRKIIFSMLVNKESQSAIINIGIISSADGYKRSFTYKWPKPILDVGFPFLILKITLLWILVTINGTKAFFFVNSKNDREMAQVCNGDNLWQRSWSQIRLNGHFSVNYFIN